MGIDIHVTVLGRKEIDNLHPDTTYRALKFYKKDGEDYRGFDFPYFRNSFFFQELQDHFGRNYWNGVRSNIENPDIIKWYDDSFEEYCKIIPFEERKFFIWGHTWIRLKDLVKWKEKLKKSYKNEEDSEEYKELIDCIDFMYNSVKKMLDFDIILEDRFDFEYDVDNSILLIAFDN